jgi:hypothetical protein
MSWSALALVGGTVVFWAVAKHFGLVGMGAS